MPLTKANVTAASRIMLPTYVTLFLGFGIVYTFDPFGRNATNNGLDVLREIGMPVWLWGVLFLATSVLMAAALLIPDKHGRHRQWFVFALYLAALVMGLWALVFLGSVIFGHAALTAPLWPILGVQSCRASARSLIRGERS